MLRKLGPGTCVIYVIHWLESPGAFSVTTLGIWDAKTWHCIHSRYHCLSPGLLCFQRVSCPYCHNSYVTPTVLRRHIREIHMQRKDFSCPFCDMSFSQKANMESHWKRRHKDSISVCGTCRKPFATREEFHTHQEQFQHSNWVPQGQTYSGIKITFTLCAPGYNWSVFKVYRHSFWWLDLVEIYLLLFIVVWNVRLILYQYLKRNPSWYIIPVVIQIHPLYK